MKLETVGHYDSWRKWAVGFHAHSRRYGTLVAFIGTGWGFGLSRTATSFGLCFGPLCIGGAR